MKKVNKKVVQIFCLIAFAVGSIGFVLVRIFGDSLSDFMQGYWEGFTTILMVFGACYIFWNLIKKGNPFLVR